MLYLLQLNTNEWGNSIINITFNLSLYLDINQYPEGISTTRCGSAINQPITQKGRMAITHFRLSKALALFNVVSKRQ